MTKISCTGYRFPPEIIDQAIWLYLRFMLSFRDVEDLLAERGIAQAPSQTALDLASGRGLSENRWAHDLY
jgi:transposase-like protein